MKLGWKEKLIDGALPSDLLAEEYERNPDITAGQAAENFISELPDVDRRIAVFARRWNRGRDTELGLNTNDLDNLILEIFERWIKDNPN